MRVYVVICISYPHNSDLSYNCDVFSTKKEAIQSMILAAERVVRDYTAVDRNGYQYCEEADIEYADDVMSCTVSNEREDVVNYNIYEREV